MNFDSRPLIFFKVILLLLHFPLLLFADTLRSGCGSGKPLLFFKTAGTVDSMVRPRFSGDLFNALNAPLKEIGYCPVLFDQHIHQDTSFDNDQMLYIVVLPGVPVGTEGTPSTLLINLLSVKNFKPNVQVQPSGLPLISLVVDSGEISALVSVTVRKTIENLRTQYICHLRLQSDPAGVLIKANNGLEGSTPLEWIIPVGELKITGALEKYSSLSRTLDLSEPGIHTYVLEMRRRHFYNSKFMIPTAIFGVSSAVLFTYERYFYSKYLALGRDEYFNNPEKFESIFNKARKFEYAAFSALALTGVSFSFCFIF